jgi:hypothetical protein
MQARKKARRRGTLQAQASLAGEVARRAAFEQQHAASELAG